MNMPDVRTYRPLCRNRALRYRNRIRVHNINLVLLNQVPNRPNPGTKVAKKGNGFSHAPFARAFRLRHPSSYRSAMVRHSESPQFTCEVPLPRNNDPGLDPFSIHPLN